MFLDDRSRHDAEAVAVAEPTVYIPPTSIAKFLVNHVLGLYQCEIRPKEMGPYKYWRLRGDRRKECRRIVEGILRLYDARITFERDDRGTFWKVEVSDERREGS